MKHLSVKKLLIMAALHFVIMYLVMYSMVNTFDNVFLNINNAYMAAIMTTPMLILEIILMGSMYENKRLLTIISGLSIFLFFLFFVFIRQQTFIYEGEFIRSMIPHHSGAILMCNKAKINDAELKELCHEIVIAQQEEIKQMKQILQRI